MRIDLFKGSVLVIVLTLLCGYGLDVALVYAACFCAACPLFALSVPYLAGVGKINSTTFCFSLITIWMTIAIIHSGRLYQLTQGEVSTPLARMTEAAGVASVMLVPATFVLLTQAIRQHFARKK